MRSISPGQLTHGLGRRAEKWRTSGQAGGRPLGARYRRAMEDSCWPAPGPTTQHHPTPPHRRPAPNNLPNQPETLTSNDGRTTGGLGLGGGFDVKRQDTVYADGSIDWQLCDNGAVAPWPLIIVAGAAVGLSMGLFGVGGSSVATPVLALLGAPGLIAVASPLPATIPAAAVGAVPYVRSKEARPRAAGWSMLGGVPGTILGAWLSRLVGGSALLLASGVVLVIVGLRVLRPIEQVARDAAAKRRENRQLLVASTAGVGVFTGLLANGGGFLLVPLYLLVFGLRMRQAVGTSLVVIAVLAIPTLATHWALGHINWTLAGEFAIGLLPGSAVGSRLAHRVEGPTLRKAFGWFLVAFGVFFTIYRLVRG